MDRRDRSLDLATMDRRDRSLDLAVYLLRPLLVAIVFLAVAGSIFGFWPGVIAAGIGFFWMLAVQYKEEDEWISRRILRDR